jgi:hypothetical protein
MSNQILRGVFMLQIFLFLRKKNMKSIGYFTEELYQKKMDAKRLPHLLLIL